MRWALWKVKEFCGLLRQKLHFAVFVWFSVQFRHNSSSSAPIDTANHLPANWPSRPLALQSAARKTPIMLSVIERVKNSTIFHQLFSAIPTMPGR
jgi:hypothetical protein